MDLLTIILALVAVGIALYIYSNNRNIFLDLDIPHDPAMPILGNMAPCFFRKINFFLYLQKLYNAHPEAKYFGMYDFRTPVIVIRDPEIIKSIGIKNFETFTDRRTFTDEKLDPLFGKGLFSLEGDYWKEVRCILSPCFTSSKMKVMFNLITECSVKFTDALLERSKDENYLVNLKDVFAKLASDIISSCAFGISVDSMQDPKNELYVTGRNATDFEGSLSLKFMLSRNFKTLSKLFNVKFLNDSVNRFFTDVISSNIATRIEKGITRPDFLQLMMEAKDKNNANRKLSLQEIVANSFQFVFAGLDTVSTSLCYIVHAIAVNPEVQNRLHEEIDSVLEDCNQEPTYNDINNMAYLEAVINEGLRLYTTVAFVDRVCSKKFELPPVLPGKKPLNLEPGMSVLIPISAIHRDPNYYENPEKFDPERFLGDNKVKENTGTYMPFSIGPRMCIGNRFALLEMKVSMFHILSRCCLKPCSKTSEPMTFRKDSFVLMPDGGFWLRIEARN